MIDKIKVFKSALVISTLLVIYLGWLSSSSGQDNSVAQHPSLCIDDVHKLNRLLMGHISHVIFEKESVDMNIRADIKKQLDAVSEDYDRCLYSKDPVPGTEEYYQLSGYLGVFVLKFGLRSDKHKNLINETLRNDYKKLLILIDKILNSEDAK